MLALMLVKSFVLPAATPCLAAPDDISGVSLSGVVCRPGMATAVDLASPCQARLLVFNDQVEWNANMRGQAPGITITAIEATGAVIHPKQAFYNLDQPADVLTTVTWNDTSAVDSIVDDGGNTLAEGVDYRVGPLNGTATLAILDDYLSLRLTEVGNEVQLTINFDSYAQASFVITAVSGEMTIQYTLTISSTVGGSVSEPGEGVFTYDAGSVVDLVAGADEGYGFSGWSGDVGSLAAVDAGVTSITMDDSYSVTAVFAAQVREGVVNKRLIGGVIAAIVAAGAAIFLVRRRRTAST